ncbi:TMEM175 family protein [Subtercola sp. RTI3]|uniref:TMEM175 family protein n=1 Tax=Subtercola sp. RTI3 TaxID=3048639 RepID=UPI002B236187|nr:TMEM175 family protein [Subtercola sp. RTI3]MEA9984629.1 TMEM175 family protein [Subtercola sp. RTI3]
MGRPTKRNGMARLEAFSDAVLAIVLTLLVLDLLPNGAQSPEQLLGNWPTYVAYLAAFLTIGIIWLNHNEELSRVAKTTPIVLVLNLGLLLGASLVPWPTALISAALREGDHDDQFAAMVVFAVVAAVISVPWVALDLYLARHPELLNTPDGVSWMRRHALYSAGTLVVAVVSVVVAIFSPLAALVLYLVVAAAFLLARLFERESRELTEDD